MKIASIEPESGTDRPESLLTLEAVDADGLLPGRTPAPGELIRRRRGSPDVVVFGLERQAEEAHDPCQLDDSVSSSGPRHRLGSFGAP